MDNNSILGAYCENAIAHLSKAIEASNNKYNRLAIDEVNASINLLNSAIQSAKASEDLAPDNPLPLPEPSRCEVCASPLKTMRTYRGKKLIVCPKCGPVNLQVQK